MKKHILAILLCLAAAPAFADGETCLSAGQQRQAIAESKAVPLAKATEALKARHNGDVVNVRLCDTDGKLSYYLTVVDKQGKVMRAVVDATNGNVVHMR